MVSVGDQIRIVPYDGPAEVYKVRQENGRIVLSVVFQFTHKAQTFVFTPEQFAEKVQLLPSFREDFSANALRKREPFILFADALRMQLAYTFDPHYAVSVSQVDLLPHQVDAVYRHILPMPRIRFLLADDPG